MSLFFAKCFIWYMFQKAKNATMKQLIIFGLKISIETSAEYGKNVKNDIL